MRRAFTLIELLTIVAIIGVMVSVAMVGFGSGQGAARIKGASRDIFAAIRQARSVALVTQQPAIITYEETEIDGEKSARVKITTARMMTQAASRAQTLSGEWVTIGGDDEGGTSTQSDGEESLADGQGETVEDVLFAPISSDVLRGVRIKVALGDEENDFAFGDDARKKPRISVFSNVDYLLGKYDKERKRTDAGTETGTDEKAESSGLGTSLSSASLDLQEARSVVWETNGRCDPHRVWIYRDGTSPEKGLSIKVDRFGGAKIVSGDER